MPSIKPSPDDPTAPDPGTPNLGVRDFYAANRGGGLFTETFSQRLGALVALGSARAGIRPTTLTLTNLVIALATSALVMYSGERISPALGMLALVGWQMAYALDCADGQLARVTSTGSPAGARIDILCDVAAQIALVTALVVVARPPLWLAALFAGTWMVNLVTSVLASNDPSTSMVPSRSLPVRVVKLVRDYGAVVFAAGLVLAIAPDRTLWLVAAFTVVNGGFLLAGIVFTARAALRAGRPAAG